MIRDVVETAGSGVFVPPGDKISLANAVRQLKSDPGTALAMDCAGKEYVRKHYHVQTVADRFEDVFELAVNGKES